MAASESVEGVCSDPWDRKAKCEKSKNEKARYEEHALISEIQDHWKSLKRHWTLRSGTFIHTIMYSYTIESG